MSFLFFLILDVPDYAKKNANSALDVPDYAKKNAMATIGFRLANIIKTGYCSKAARGVRRFLAKCLLEQSMPGRKKLDLHLTSHLICFFSLFFIILL